MVLAWSNWEGGLTCCQEARQNGDGDPWQIYFALIPAGKRGFFTVASEECACVILINFNYCFGNRGIMGNKIRSIQRVTVL